MLVKNLPLATAVVSTDKLIVEQPSGTKQVAAGDLAAAMYPLAAVPGLSDHTDPAKGAGLVGWGSSLPYPANSVGWKINNLVTSLGLAETSAHAAATYLPISTAAATYLPISTAVSAYASKADLVDTSDLTKNVGSIGFNRTLNYVAGTLGATFIEWNPRDYPWLAKFDGATDDTAAMLACWTAIYNAGGGTMVLPAGTTGITSLVLNYATSMSVNIRGAGQHATYLKKIGGGTAPVLDIQSNAGVLDCYSKFSGFQVLGTGGCTGIRLTLIASLTFEYVEARVCGVAWDLVGALVNTFSKCAALSSATGVRTRKSGTTYCNSNRFIDFDNRSNTTLGWDIGDANDLLVEGGHTENCGTSSNTATGGVHILATVDDETGLSLIAFRSHHFEAQLGLCFGVDAAAGLLLRIEDTTFASSEGGRVLNVGAITNVTLDGVVAAAPGDVVTLAAASSDIGGCDIATITDTSTHQLRRVTTGSGGVTPFSTKTASIGTGGLTLDTTAKIKGGTTYTDNGPLATFQDGAAAGNAIEMFMTNGAAANAAACSLRLGRSGTTSRSINAGGTVNASGADYAEYEVKAEGCGLIAKGDIAGFDADGLLTDRFDDAISFGIKSTDPSLVGGDSWFAEEPPEPAKIGAPERPASVLRLPDEIEEEWTVRRTAYRAALQAYSEQVFAMSAEMVRQESAYEASLAEYVQRFEAARQQVDRIAYAGKTPVNIIGAKAGQWIDAGRKDDGGIRPLPVDKPSANTVGRVRSLLLDGRALVVVVNGT